MAQLICAQKELYMILSMDDIDDNISGNSSHESYNSISDVDCVYDQCELSSSSDDSLHQ